MIRYLLEYQTHMFCGYRKAYSHIKIFSKNNSCPDKDFKKFLQKSGTNSDKKLLTNEKIYANTYIFFSSFFQHSASIQLYSLPCHVYSFILYII